MAYVALCHGSRAAAARPDERFDVTRSGSGRHIAVTVPAPDERFDVTVPAPGGVSP